MRERERERDLNAEYSGIRFRTVGMATGIQARRSGVRNPVGENGFFCPSKCPARLGAHSASYSMDIGVIPGVKRPGLDVDLPPPCSVEVILHAATLRSVHVQLSI